MPLSATTTSTSEWQACYRNIQQWSLKSTGLFFARRINSTGIRCTTQRCPNTPIATVHFKVFSVLVLTLNLSTTVLEKHFLTSLGLMNLTYMRHLTRGRRTGCLMSLNIYFRQKFSGRSAETLNSRLVNCADRLSTNKTVTSTHPFTWLVISEISKHQGLWLI